MKVLKVVCILVVFLILSFDVWAQAPFPNPECSITVEPTKCEGPTTTVGLQATVILPNPSVINYSWNHTCGANSSIVGNTDSVELFLLDPALGKSVSCNITLDIDAPTGAVDAIPANFQCNVDVFVEPCETDCLGRIIVNDPQLAANDPNVVLPGDAAVNDRCGECNGDGQSCINCDSANQLEQLFKLDGNSFQQKRLVQKSVGLLRKVTDSNTGSEYLNQAESLYFNNWALTWSIPEVTVDCNASTFCTTVESNSNVKDYDANAVALRDLAISVARKARSKNKSTGNLYQRRVRKLTKRLIRKANSAYQEAISVSTNIDTTTDICF